MDVTSIVRSRYQDDDRMVSAHLVNDTIICIINKNGDKNFYTFVNDELVIYSRNTSYDKNNKHYSRFKEIFRNIKLEKIDS